MLLMNLLVDWTLDKKKFMKQRIQQQNPQIEKPRGQRLNLIRVSKDCGITTKKCIKYIQLPHQKQRKEQKYLKP